MFQLVMHPSISVSRCYIQLQEDPKYLLKAMFDLSTRSGMGKWLKAGKQNGSLQESLQIQAQEGCKAQLRHCREEEEQHRG